MTAMRWVAVLVCVLLVAACGGDDDDADAVGEAAPPASTDPCDTVRTLSEIDDEFQAEINEAMRPLVEGGADSSDEEAFAAFRDVIERLDDEVDGLRELYGDLESQLDGELAESAATLRDFTAELIDALREIESFDELQALGDLFAGEHSAAAVQATLKLDRWSQDECDVVLAD